jgi:VCBS repeat-containing protein
MSQAWGSSLSVGPAGALPNDRNANGDSLFADLNSGPSHGSLTLNADGSLSYTPDGTFSGSDSFTFQASDGVLTSSAQTVSISGPDLTATGDTLSATAGIATGSIQVATVTDTDTALTAAGLNASVRWSDGTSATTVTSSGGGIVQNLDGTFSIYAGHTYIAYGTLPVKVTVNDTVNSLSDTADSTAVVADPVSLTNPGTQTSSEGATVSKSLTSSDAISGATLTFLVQGLPPGLTFDPSTGAISGTVAAGDAAAGPYSVDVTATDGTYGQSVQFTWNVTSAISLTNPGTQSNAEGDSVSLSLSASDATSGATLSFAAVGLPAGLKINTTTGAITGTVAAGAAALGPYDVTVTAEDGSTSLSQEFTWNISSPVTLAVIPDQTSSEGDTVSLAVSGSDTTSGATLSYTATGLPAGLKINTSTGAITGTLAAGAAALGPYAVTVTAQDGSASATQSFTWNVNSPITITPPDDQTNHEGDAVSLSVSASDATSGATLTYGAIGLPAGLSINASTGAITGTITAGAAANGPFSVLLLAGDGTSGITTSPCSAFPSRVTDRAPPFSLDSPDRPRSCQEQAFLAFEEVHRVLE